MRLERVRTTDDSPVLCCTWMYVWPLQRTAEVHIPSVPPFDNEYGAPTGAEGGDSVRLAPSVDGDVSPREMCAQAPSQTIVLKLTTAVFRWF